MNAKIIIVGILTALLFFLPAVIADYNWETGKTGISVSSATFDINDVVYFPIQTLTPGNSTYVNITLPGNLANFSADETMLNLQVEEGGTLYYNFTVNGVTSTYWNSTTTGTIHWSLANWTDQGVDNTSTYLNITVDNWNPSGDNSSVLSITLVADDGVLTDTSIFGTMQERISTTPKVLVNLTDSYYVVHDRIKVTNNYEFNLTYVNATITYPSIAVSQGSTTLVWSSVTKNGGYKYAEVGYQKQGPWVRDIDAVESGNTHNITIEVRAYEDIDNATWTIDPTSEEYSEYFTNLNYDTLEITRGSTEITWEQEDGNIVIDDLSLDSGTNTYMFTYTEEVALPPTAVPLPWYQQTIAGIPVWAILVIAVLAVVAILVIASKK